MALLIQIFPKLSLKISCNVESTPTLSRPQPAQRIQEKRQLRHDAMKQFLLKECLLSRSELPTIMSKDASLFRCRSIDTAQQAVEFFKDSGFTIHQVRKTILKEPSVLRCTVDMQLKPKIELIKALGLDGNQVGYIVSRQPRILWSSLKKKLNPRISLLVKLFGSKAKVSKALLSAPPILLYDFETLKTKLKNLENFGLHKREIKEMLKKDPRFLCTHMDKIQKNMDFLMHIAGFQPIIVLKYPLLLNLSVDKRMLPRYKVFEYVTTTLNSEYLKVNLVGMFCLSEGDFEEKFTRDRPCVAEIYEKYKGNSVDVELN